MATTQNGIYYPNNYNSPADIPSDLKKMAESIDKSIQDNNYDDTEIKQDIQELQTKNEEQDEKIETIEAEQESQNDLLQRTKSALINITTEKSDCIHVEDSSNLTAKIDVYGTSSQETREGYNLLNVASEFEVTGRSSAVAISLKPNTDYTIKVDNIETTNENPTTLAISFRNTSDASVRDVAFPYTGRKTTFQVTEEATKVYIYSADNYNDSQGVTTTYTNLMIYEGTDDKTYEEYGESPSPEFESKIENVEGNVDITVANSNLTSTKIVEDLNNSGVTINSDSSFKIDLSKGSFTDWNQIDLLFGNNKKDEQYKLTYHINQNNNAYLPKFRFIYTDGTADGGNANTGSTDIDMEVTSQLGKTIERISLSWNTQSGGGIVTFSNIYLRKKEDTSNFVEPEKQTITFPLQAGQKLYKGDYPAEDGIHHVRKQIEFDGTENWIKNINYSTETILAVQLQMFDMVVSTSNTLCNYFKYNSDNTTVNTYRFAGNYLLIKLDVSEFPTIEAFKTWLVEKKTAETPVVVEYELAEEEIEPYTPEQQEAYNKLQNVLSYKTVTNVFTDTALLEFKYVADTETWVINEIKPLKEQISTINELLSTTGTSALLLDNMQTDLESEVI